MNRPIASASILAFALSACSGAASTPPPAATGPAAQPGATTPAAAGGGAKGYDCATLLTPSELDTASGLKGGAVVTNRRGDQADPGSVMGVTECGISYENVSTWFGHFNVVTGAEALDNFKASWDFAKGEGATSVSGVGTEAIVLSNEAGVNMWTRGSNGAAISLGIAWDEETTTEDAVKAAEKQILTIVLPRT